MPATRPLVTMKRASCHIAVVQGLSQPEFRPSVASPFHKTQQLKKCLITQRSGNFVNGAYLRGICSLASAVIVLYQCSHLDTSLNNYFLFRLEVGRSIPKGATHKQRFSLIWSLPRCLNAQDPSPGSQVKKVFLGSELVRSFAPSTSVCFLRSPRPCLSPSALPSGLVCPTPQAVRRSLLLLPLRHSLTAS